MKKALNDSNTKPIFVTNHFPPRDTVYGSKEWGDSLLNDILKNIHKSLIFQYILILV